MGCVYLARNKINGKVYIGKTVYSFTHRKKQHLAAARRGDKSPLYRAIRKYGARNFEWKVLFESCSETVLLEKEKALIVAHSSRTFEHGYNVTEGGKGASGWIPSSRTRKKISTSNKGRVVTEKSRQSISESIKKLWKNKAYRTKTVESQRSRAPISDSTRSKLRASSKSNWQNPEFVARMEEINTERTRVAKAKKEERRRNRPKKTLKGKTFEEIYGDKADEQRAKRSAALKDSKKVSTAAKKAWDNPERRRKSRLSYEDQYGVEAAAVKRKKISESMKAYQQRKREQKHVA